MINFNLYLILLLKFISLTGTDMVETENAIEAVSNDKMYFSVGEQLSCIV